MNILIIPTNDWTRAPGRGHINSIAEELAERGHKVYAWNFDFYTGNPIKRHPKKIRLINPRTLHVPDAALFFTLNSFYQFPQMLKSIRELNIDVIINENVLSGALAFLAAKNRALNVFDFSDYFPESASVYYSGSSIAGKTVEAVTLAVTKLNVKLADICLAVCQSLVNAAAGMDKKKPCFVIHNGVDTCSITPKATSTENSMVVMGVIDDWLDLETPIEALNRLTSEFPELKLIIIGPWQKAQQRRRFEEHVKSLGLEAKVKVTGYITTDEMNDYLQNAACCLMPYKTDKFYSVIRLPEKLFMYSAFGKPILSTWLPEVKALKSPHIFFYKSADELAEKAAQLISDKNSRVDLSAKACQFAQQNSFKMLAEKLEGILVENVTKLRMNCQASHFGFT